MLPHKAGRVFHHRSTESTALTDIKITLGPGLFLPLWQVRDKPGRQTVGPAFGTL
jgi:hypothetical protein